MAGPYDALIVGSGFGGAVTACRLAEAGYRVLVLERGRRWEPATFPREPGDPWFWDHVHPERANGWLDMRLFWKMGVAQGAGVGGGSLIYANISVEADRAAFAAGWPPEVTYAELAPHYKTVGAMLNVQTVPVAQWPERTRLMYDAATAIGEADRFRPLELAVNFDPGWRPDLPEPHAERHSRTFRNAQNLEQGTCVHAGLCDIGCPVRARNSLDFNYLARAEANGAEIRPLHLVRFIEPAASGYRVHVDRIADGRLERLTEEARVVVVAAGSLGSTELLLRSRDVHHTLPGLPGALGHGWSANGDFLTLGYHPARHVAPTAGPTITSAIDFRDGHEGGRAFLIEDGGFPGLAAIWLRERTGRWAWYRRRRVFKEFVRSVLRHGDDTIDHTMPWFAQGRDAADGRLRLGRQWWLLGPQILKLDWDVKASLPLVDAIAAMHERLAHATGGRTFLPPTWEKLHYLLTPHPLGGCNMGTTAATSVVDHRGEVWGHRNLYVADGAIVPEAIGANPSRTIAALAERIARLIVEEGR